MSIGKKEEYEVEAGRERGGRKTMGKDYIPGKGFQGQVGTKSSCTRDSRRQRVLDDKTYR